MSQKDEPPKPKRSYSLPRSSPRSEETPPEPQRRYSQQPREPLNGDGPWGNIIQWPCPGTYSQTLRAKLYSFRAFDRTWQDGGKAKRAFFPWRDQWLAAEQASRALGAALLERAPELFRGLPLAPTTFFDQTRAQGIPVELPQFRSAPRDERFLSTYGNLTLAYIAHAWASLGGGVVALRFNERTIAAYVMARPSCQLAIYATANVAPGAIALELAKVDQWWIPPGAGWLGWRDEKWKGEVAATDPSTQIARSFVHGFFEGLAAMCNWPPPPSPNLRPSYRVSAGSDAATTIGVLPEGGDSTDLMLLLAARRNFAQRCGVQELTPAHVVTKSGEPLFAGLEGSLNALRQGLLTSMYDAMEAAQQRMAQALHDGTLH